MYYLGYFSHLFELRDGILPVWQCRKIIMTQFYRLSSWSVEGRSCLRTQYFWQNSKDRDRTFWMGTRRATSSKTKTDLPPFLSAIVHHKSLSFQMFTNWNHFQKIVLGLKWRICCWIICDHGFRRALFVALALKILSISQGIPFVVHCEIFPKLTSFWNILLWK